MRKVLKTNNKCDRVGLRGLAALTLAMSLAAFGCTTNRYPGNGEPEMGPMKTPTSTPGTSSGTTGAPPETMVSSSPLRPSSADAIAILKANEAYRGIILGSSDPGIAPQVNGSAQQVTGQFVPPSLSANPQLTVNTSVSSTPVPVITSGAGSIAIPTVGSVTASSAASPTPSVSAATSSITSATPPAGTTLAVSTTPLTNAVALNNGIVTAPSTTSGVVMALPSVVTAPVPATAVSATPAAPAVAIAPAVASRSTSPDSTTVLGTTNAPLRVERPASVSGVVVTNQPQSLTQRFLRMIGVRRSTTAPATSNGTSTTTGTTTAPLVPPNQ